jgi:hypothetical protein
VTRRDRGTRTTMPAKDGTRAGDLLDRDFTATAPIRSWVTDFIYSPHTPDPTTQPRQPRDLGEPARPAPVSPRARTQGFIPSNSKPVPAGLTNDRG